MDWIIKFETEYDGDFLVKVAGADEDAACNACLDTYYDLEITAFIGKMITYDEWLASSPEAAKVAAAKAKPGIVFYEGALVLF